MYNVTFSGIYDDIQYIITYRKPKAVVEINTRYRVKTTAWIDRWYKPVVVVLCVVVGVVNTLSK